MKKFIKYYLLFLFVFYTKILYNIKTLFKGSKMKYPNFYNDIENIKLKDNLAEFLGAIEGGEIEFSYLDIVKSAGHSCPTVAGAYLCALHGLKALYKNDIAIRGDIEIHFKEDLKDGVAGVISNVFSQITGATLHSGFKGINNNFARNNLMYFNSDITSSVKIKRLDTNKFVEVIYNPSSIEVKKEQQELMQRIMSSLANKDEKKLFASLWQDRVKRIFENQNDVIKIIDND